MHCVFHFCLVWVHFHGFALDVLWIIRIDHSSHFFHFFNSFSSLFAHNACCCVPDFFGLVHGIIHCCCVELRCHFVHKSFFVETWSGFVLLGQLVQHFLLSSYLLWIDKLCLFDHVALCFEFFFYCHRFLCFVSGFEFVLHFLFEVHLISIHLSGLFLDLIDVVCYFHSSPFFNHFHCCSSFFN